MYRTIRSNLIAIYTVIKCRLISMHLIEETWINGNVYDLPFMRDAL